MYYAATNSYSTDTSVGFCNTWFCISFPTRAARDEYVRQCPKLATKAIKASEVRKYGGLGWTLDQILDHRAVMAYDPFDHI